jgi:hypothetical protein
MTVPEASSVGYAYIDNLCRIGGKDHSIEEKDKVIRDVSSVYARAFYVGAITPTMKNDLELREFFEKGLAEGTIDPRKPFPQVTEEMRRIVGKYIVQEAEYPGINFDLRVPGKPLVSLTKKVHTKVATAWERRNSWTWRNLFAYISLLRYTHAVLGSESLEITALFPVLKYYCHIAREMYHNPALWDEAAQIPLVVVENLKLWTEHALANKPVSTWNPEDSFKRVIATDACATGAGLICWDIESNTIQEAVVRWDRHGIGSSHFETEALCTAIQMFAPGPAAGKTLVINDNSAAIEAVNTRYSHRFGLFCHLCPTFAAGPLVQGRWHEGKTFERPDKLSRGLPSAQSEAQMVEVMKRYVEVATLEDGKKFKSKYLHPSLGGGPVVRNTSSPHLPIPLTIKPQFSMNL